MALVVASDAAYFPMLDSFLAALEAQVVVFPLKRIVLDLGLSPDQTHSLTSRVDHVMPMPWAIDFPGRADVPQARRGQLNRPFIPQLLPGFDLYLLLDVDGWVQDATCLKTFITAAAAGALAIVPERFGPPIKYGTRLPDGRIMVHEIDETSIRANLATCYRDCFGVTSGPALHGAI
ncbi:MAG TPA: hypothetical protein VF669_07555, partial [Tepidisphaeraceae bacterium]